VLAGLLGAAGAPVAPAGTVVGWGDNNHGQLDAPAELTNAVAVASGFRHSLALTRAGTIVPWGDNYFGQTNVPAGLSNVVAVAAGSLNSVALRADGSLIAWGNNHFNLTNPPPDLTNVVAVAGGSDHYLALRRDGAVAGWGWNDTGQTNPPAGLSNVVAVAAGSLHSVALRANGEVVAWGHNFFGQSSVPPTLSNVVAISAGAYHTLALQADGTVVAWGDNASGLTSVPRDASNVIAIASGAYHALALRADGAVIAWGQNDAGQTTVPATLSNVTAVAAGTYQSLAVLDGGPPFLSAAPVDATVDADATARFVGRATGALPLSYQWQRNGGDIAGATNAALLLPAAQPADAGAFTLVVSNAFGAVTSAPAILTVIGKPPAIVAQPRGQVVSPGWDVTLAVTATGTEPLAYQWFFNGVDVPDETNASLAFPGVKLADGGDYFVVISNVAGAVTSAVATLAVVEFDLALESGELRWRSDGDAPWFVQTNVTHDGADAAQSGAFAGAGQSGLATTVMGPGTLAFWWKVSSAGPQHPLRCSVNGALTAQIYGEADWEQRVILLPAGEMELSWEYRKDDNPPAGLDAAWLDEVSFTPGGTAPTVTNQPSSQNVLAGATVTFSASAVGTLPLRFQWQFNGADIPGATNPTFVVVSAQPRHVASYRLVVSNDFGSDASAEATLIVRNVAAWGRNSGGQTIVPPDLTNAVAVSGGYDHSLALRADGTVAAWGTNSFGQTTVPASVTNVVALAAGRDHNLVLKAGGTVAVWGRNNFGQLNLPAGLTNVTAVASGYDFCMALKADGTVRVWGRTDSGQTNVPAGAAANLVAIAAGGYHCLALRNDGLVFAWGSNFFGPTTVPPGLSNVVAIAGGGEHSLAIQADGTTVAWGYNSIGQSSVPPQMTEGAQVSGGRYFSLGLRGDGNVIGWGFPFDGAVNVPANVTNVIAIAAGGWHSMALIGDGAPVVTVPPLSQTVFSGANVTLNTRAVGRPPLTYRWQRDGVDVTGPTTPWLTLPGAQVADSGAYRIVVSNALGVVTSAVATVTVRLSLADALDAPALAWTTSGGSAAWAGQTDTAHDGSDAARSGVIGHSQQSVLQTSVSGPGTLTFWWKVSSETNNDTLRFLVNSVAQTSLSGETDWRQETVYLTAGNKILQWRYVKNASASAGQDAGWVDQVSYTPGASAPVILSQPSNQSVLAGGNATFSVTAGGTPPLSYQWRKDGTNVAGATNTTLTLTNLHRRDSGLVSVLVTNAQGSAPGSNAVLTVRAPQRLVLLPPAGDGLAALLFGDADGNPLLPGDADNFEIRASTNLVDWVALAGELTLTNGLLLRRDADSTNHPARFYQVLER
jgi:alpha-tubulin suppressor-like RCC1 family protein